MSTTTLHRTTRTRVRHSVLAANFSVLLLNYADRAVMGVAAPLIIAEFGFSKSTFGWILAAFAFTYSPFGFIGGWLADKLGPRNAMSAAIVVWSAFTALTAAGVGFVSLFLIRLAFGAGEGPQAPITAKLMHNWFPTSERGTAIGIANAATPLGGAVGTPVVVAIMSATNGNWRLPFIVFGALGVLALIGWLAVVRDTPEQHPKANAAEAEHIRPKDVEGAEDEASTTGGRPWRHYLKLPVVWSTALAYFGYAWILWTFLSWFPTFLVQERGIDLSQLAWAGAIPWVGGFLGLTLGGYATDRLVRRSGKPLAPRRNNVVICLGISSLLFGLIGMVNSTLTAIVVMTAVVFFLYLTGAQYWVIIGEAVPRHSYGAVAGAVQMFATTASIIAPLVTGYLIDSAAGWFGTFLLAAVIALLGTVMLAIFGRTDVRAQLPGALPATPQPQGNPAERED